ncbi:YbhB/YbcL family Raf kinase inhibitor-like protein [Streptomyces sp. C10-9-1]|uniref:YbhB/YbcL family Raf kinase inhibitor-like protein n=1 Tax=Streptomyces sp. C10-9-1 TaxID=1859285 RepID=UPI003F4A115C
MKKPPRHGVAEAVTARTTTTEGDNAGSEAAPANQTGFGYTEIRKGVPDSATRFTVTSPDVRDGQALPADTWAAAFGCTGDNRQIRLSWSGAPHATRSYAVTMFDPDAPTGSGFWHWFVWDIPLAHTRLDGALPPGAVAGTGDSGTAGYFGPCPPSGDLVHRYDITVYALDVPTLGLPATTPPTVASFTMSGHVIGYARITGTARR